jgi:hypothetical protein
MSATPESVNGQLFYPMLTRAGSTSSRHDVPPEQDREYSLHNNPTCDSHGGPRSFPQRRHACGLLALWSLTLSPTTSAPSDWIYTPRSFALHHEPSNTIDSYSIRIFCSTVMVFSVRTL